MGTKARELALQNCNYDLFAKSVSGSVKRRIEREPLKYL